MNERSIIIPDTGSKIAIAGIVLGVVLVCVGGYVIYTKKHKS